MYNQLVLCPGVLYQPPVKFHNSIYFKAQVDWKETVILVLHFHLND